MFRPRPVRNRGRAVTTACPSFLVPMDQPGRVEVRPIRQLTGTSEFNEVFFDGAVARAEHVVGGAGNGWQVAMSLLGLNEGSRPWPSRSVSRRSWAG